MTDRADLGPHRLARELPSEPGARLRGGWPEGAAPPPRRAGRAQRPVHLLRHGLQAFGAIARISSGLYEDRTAIWPGKPGTRDDYPWWLPSAPELVLDAEAFVPASELVSQLEHVRKWPAEDWHLAFQGQLRTVPEADAALIEERMRAAADGAGGQTGPTARTGAHAQAGTTA